METNVAATISLAVLMAFASGAAAQDADRKENLDLPFNAISLSEDSLEDAPEVIFFFGQQYEGDGFFFCLDRSGSTADGQLGIEKRELGESIRGLSERVQFGIVFYGSSVVKHPANGIPSAASPGEKSAAIAFTNSVEAGGYTCVSKGLEAVLELANRSSAPRNVIIFYSDGFTNCPGANAEEYAQRTLENVTSNNYKKIPIHAIVVGHDVSEWFPRELASRNRGTYARIER